MSLADGLAAGPTATLCEDVASESEVRWASDRELTLTSSVPEPRILAVSSDGGPIRVVAHAAAEQGFRGWFGGSPLPGGHQMPMSHWELAGKTLKMQVEVIDLATGTRKTVLPNADSGRYLPTGHLIAVRDGTTLVAVPFDVSGMKTTGGVVAIQGGVYSRGAPPFSASGTGALALVSQPPGSTTRRLAWVDEHGQAAPIPGAARAFRGAAVSPDGARVAFDLDDPNVPELPQELWVLELSRGTTSRLPTQGFPMGGFWSGDGQRITYGAVSADQTASIWGCKADGTDAPVLLYTAPGGKVFCGPETCSPDGSTLVLWRQEFGASQTDLWLLRRPEGSGAWAAAPYLNTSADESALRFSPDGKWICFRSDKSGRQELYVQRFTGSADEDARAGQYQVSSGAGGDIWWSPDGREIRYADLDQNVMSVKVQIEPAFSATLPTKLYSIKDLKTSYRVFAADGRLLVVLPGEGEQVTRIDLVLNFFDELKRKMSAAGGK